MHSSASRTVLAAAFAALLLAACEQSDPQAPPPAGNVQAPNTLTIAGIPKSTGGEFWETVETGARDAARDLGISLKWEGTLAETDIAEQNKIIENMINLGANGIALAPLNRQAPAKLVRQAADAGIPVVIFDSAVDGEAHVSFVATDNAAGGVIAGMHMVELLGPKAGALRSPGSPAPGSSPRVMVQRYVQGAGSTDARAQGFIDTVKAAGLTVAADPYPEDGSVAGAKKSAANTLETFVKDSTLELDGVFACNLYSALGALAALDDLRKSGIAVHARFIGFDSSPKLLEALQSGSCDALVVQNPRRMGYLAIETITRHLRGEQVDSFIDTGAQLVTQSRLASEPALRELVGMK